MPFRKPYHMPFRKLIPPFTLTETEKKKNEAFIKYWMLSWPFWCTLPTEDISYDASRCFNNVMHNYVSN